MYMCLRVFFDDFMYSVGVRCSFFQLGYENPVVDLKHNYDKVTAKGKIYLMITANAKHGCTCVKLVCKIRLTICDSFEVRTAQYHVHSNKKRIWRSESCKESVRESKRFRIKVNWEWSSIANFVHTSNFVKHIESKTRFSLIQYGPTKQVSPFYFRHTDSSQR